MTQFPIIEKLGGRAVVFEYLKDRGYLKTKGAISMWHHPEREVIPGDVTRELMELAERKRIAYRARDFRLIRTQETT